MIGNTHENRFSWINMLFIPAHKMIEIMLNEPMGYIVNKNMALNKINNLIKDDVGFTIGKGAGYEIPGSVEEYRHYEIIYRDSEFEYSNKLEKELTKILSKIYPNNFQKPSLTKKCYSGCIYIAYEPKQVAEKQ